LNSVLIHVQVTRWPTLSFNWEELKARVRDYSGFPRGPRRGKIYSIRTANGGNRLDYVLTRPRSRLRIRLEPELNERQREFVFSDAPAILGVAGPGSGKTRALTCRAARLLDEGLPSHNLMLVTLTNKAADEMQARLTDKLGPLTDCM